MLRKSKIGLQINEQVCTSNTGRGCKVRIQGVSWITIKTLKTS